jgi:hypothetical protein
MSSFQLKAEYQPTRCEICHQTDNFFPDRNYCLRCEGIKDRDYPINPILENKVVYKELDLGLFCVLAFFSSIVSFIGCFLFILGAPSHGTGYPLYNLLSLVIGQSFPILFFQKKKALAFKLLQWQVSGVIGVFVGIIIGLYVRIFYNQIKSSNEFVYFISDLTQELIINKYGVLIWGVVLAPIGGYLGSTIFNKLRQLKRT